MQDATTPDVEQVDVTADIIDRAKDTLITGKAKATKDNSKQVEVPDQILANELLAQRLAITDQIKELTALKTQIDNIIKDAIGSADELTVHGAVVASMSRWRQTDLNSEYIKATFKVEEYPEMFVRTTKSRLDVKK